MFALKTMSYWVIVLIWVKILIMKLALTFSTFRVSPLSLVSSSKASHLPVENLGARSHSPRVPPQPLTTTPLGSVFMGTSHEVLSLAS